MYVCTLIDAIFLSSAHSFAIRWKMFATVLWYFGLLHILSVAFVFALFFLFLPFWHPHVVDVPLIKIGNWNIDMIGLYICCCYSCRCCNCSFSICQILENIYIPLICGTLGLMSCVFSNDITLIELNKFRNLLFSKQLWAQKLVKIGLDRKSTLRPIWNVFLNK